MYGYLLALLSCYCIGISCTRGAPGLERLAETNHSPLSLCKLYVPRCARCGLYFEFTGEQISSSKRTFSRYPSTTTSERCCSGCDACIIGSLYSFHTTGADRAIFDAPENKSTVVDGLDGSGVHPAAEELSPKFPSTIYYPSHSSCVMLCPKPPDCGEYVSNENCLKFAGGLLHGASFVQLLTDELGGLCS